MARRSVASDLGAAMLGGAFDCARHLRRFSVLGGAPGGAFVRCRLRAFAHAILGRMARRSVASDLGAAVLGGALGSARQLRRLSVLSAHDGGEPDSRLRRLAGLMTVVVLLGGPGAGKGTQAHVLTERLGVPHVSTGELFRAAVRDGSPIGLEARRYMERGQLVPDDITIRMLLARLAAEDAKAGAILDGFPRNVAQAAVLDSALAERDVRVDRALYIEVPADDLAHRLSGRWVCSEAGTSI